MAESLGADSHDFERGEMPVAEQASTFHRVMGLFKWGSLALATLLIFFVMWLCTPASFFPSAVVAVIVLVAGFVFLSRKPAH